jgi:DNA-binding transcriptional LysR family regulator
MMMGMNLRNVDLNLLPVFEAIYVQRSLTRAGESLGMTQPAVSNALARLRSWLGDPLFVRRGGEMSPTPIAVRLIAPVRDALSRLRTGLDAKSVFDPKSAERTFRIAVGDTAASTIMPALALTLQRHAPGVRIHCMQIERSALPHEIAAGHVDFAIDIPSLARPELASAPLVKDRYVCTLRREHPHARRKLTLSAFLALRCISVSSRRAG